MFAVTMILLASLIGVTVYQFQASSEAYQAMINGPIQRTMAFQDAREGYQKVIAEIRGYLGYGDERYAEAVTKEMSATIETVKKVLAATTSAATKQEGEKLAAALASYDQDLKRAIAMKKANDPGLNAFVAGTRPKTETINKQFEAVFAAQDKALKQAVTNLNDKQSIVLKSVYTASAAIIILVIVLLVWYSRNLAKRLAHVSDELTAVSELDLTRKDVHSTHNDEIGDMAEALIVMKKALRMIVGQVRASADTLAASSEELTSTVEEQQRTSGVIANTTGEIAAGAAQNTNNITEISAVIEEVTAGAEEMNASAVTVNHTTQEAVTDARQGMQLIKKVVSQNDTIEKSMQEITGVSNSLVKGSAEIQEIVTVISNIAGQTNLLALNAAIEAARAGEAGRGFAVVAEEVRKLAEQSASATSHIGDIIRKMTTDIDFSVSVVGKANAEVEAGKAAATETERGFVDIVDKLGQVQEGMEQITKAVEETAKGMQAIVSNVQNISAVAEETNASTQTVAAAAEEQNASLTEVAGSAEALAKMATELNEVIRKFKV
jgi:methyl-accepting chemotaxis protein